MNEDFLNKIALSVILGFLATFSMTATEDNMEVRDYGPHRIWTAQSRVPPEIADDFDADEICGLLAQYLKRNNKHVTATRFNAYGVRVYSCPCGCGTFAYISIYR